MPQQRVVHEDAKQRALPERESTKRHEQDAGVQATSGLDVSSPREQAQFDARTTTTPSCASKM